MARLFFLLLPLSPKLLPLPCLHHLSKIPLRVFPLHFFISLFVLSWIPPLFSFLILPPTLTLYLLFSLILLWTDPLPLYPTFCLHLYPLLCPFLILFIDPYLYMPLQGLLTLLWSPFPVCIPQFFLPTPFPCPIMVVLLPWFPLFLLDLSLVVPGERLSEAGPEIGLEAG